MSEIEKFVAELIKNCSIQSEDGTYYWIESQAQGYDLDGSDDLLNFDTAIEAVEKRAIAIVKYVEKHAISILVHLDQLDDDDFDSVEQDMGPDPTLGNGYNEPKGWK